jgi:hypothetical protein
MSWPLFTQVIVALSSRSDKPLSLMALTKNFGAAESEACKRCVATLHQCNGDRQVKDLRTRYRCKGFVVAEFMVAAWRIFNRTIYPCFQEERPVWECKFSAENTWPKFTIEGFREKVIKGGYALRVRLDGRSDFWPAESAGCQVRRRSISDDGAILRMNVSNRPQVPSGCSGVRRPLPPLKPLPPPNLVPLSWFTSSPSRPRRL